MEPRNRRAALLAALFVVTTGIGLTIASTPAAAQRTRPKMEAPSPAVSQLRRMLQAEGKRAYTGRETTFIVGGRQSEQIIKRDPRLGLRIEFLRSPNDILVDDFKRSWFLSQRDKRLVERDSRIKEYTHKTWEVLSRIRSGELKADLVGREVVAGRDANIIQVSPAPGVVAPSRRFWVDKETGLRLKTEEVGPDGRVLSSTYFLSVDLSPTFDSDDFTRPTPPAGFRIVRDDTQSFTSLKEAAKRVRFPLRKPGYLPPGFELRTVSVRDFRGDKMVMQRYTNGLNSLSLVQTDAGDLPATPRKNRDDVMSPRGPRVLTWRDGSLSFALVGNLPQDQMQRIADSVR